MKNIVVVLITLWALACASGAQPTGYNTGLPFGRVGPAELDRLGAYAGKEGVDLIADLHRAYQNDEEALGRVFIFSLKFKKLDRNAKTYGHLIYSSFLNLSEVYGPERYARLVAAQPEAVRQRIRDFIYFDATQAPRKIRAEVETNARKSAPLLFPDDYVFGQDDPLFGATAPRR